MDEYEQKPLNDFQLRAYNQALAQSLRLEAICVAAEKAHRAACAEEERQASQDHNAELDKE